MIVSLLYKVARGLLSVPGVLLRRDTAKEAELLVLRHESAVLRRQLTGPVRYEPADRHRELPAQHRVLMPQHQQFGVLGNRVPRSSTAGTASSFRHLVYQ